MNKLDKQTRKLLEARCTVEEIKAAFEKQKTMTKTYFNSSYWYSVKRYVKVIDIRKLRDLLVKAF